ncbi:glycosyltransferase family 2 protein [Halioglobus pacificus]|uniref:Glycosyltransferase 2-like domain-containing protein n=1 Tax=Parahalioglobus pacificus TaxID=930806 RepID=A0A919CK98_9GAMM|nr:glycosyltransferase family A protein [Halioglobus pacificus]GHD31933.1 hypothetical protein GCM10007053_15510 [Halioglobus pacificus]
MKISVIVICYDMARELPRTLQSLQSSYQLNMSEDDYEVIVIDNGSPNPLADDIVESFGPQFRYVKLKSPPPSPAYALNYGVKEARGDIVCLMIDGAHLLTPGLLSKARDCFTINPDSVVITRYFYMGPGQQNETILEGYNKEVEDGLLAKIDWPSDGYKLFEVGMPLVFKDFPVYTWFYKMLESNCLFISKENFIGMGGADERFDIPGGGFLNLDMYKRACDHPPTQPVLIIGEGSFHQLHGGVSTNVPPDEQTRRVDVYKEQYRSIRGEDLKPVNKDFFYYGNMPTPASRIHRLNNRVKN